jgi:hypothetical protein
MHPVRNSPCVNYFLCVTYSLKTMLYGGNMENINAFSGLVPIDFRDFQSPSPNLICSQGGIIIIDKTHMPFRVYQLKQRAEQAVTGTDRYKKGTLQQEEMPFLLLGEVDEIDLPYVDKKNRCINLIEGGKIFYDHLIIVAGHSQQTPVSDQPNEDFSSGLFALQEALKIHKEGMMRTNISSAQIKSSPFISPPKPKSHKATQEPVQHSACASLAKNKIPSFQSSTSDKNREERFQKAYEQKRLFEVQV